MSIYVQIGEHAMVDTTINNFSVQLANTDGRSSRIYNNALQCEMDGKMPANRSHASGGFMYVLAITNRYN